MADYDFSALDINQLKSMMHNLGDSKSPLRTAIWNEFVKKALEEFTPELKMKAIIGEL